MKLEANCQNIIKTLHLQNTSDTTSDSIALTMMNGLIVHNCSITVSGFPELTSTHR